MKLNPQQQREFAQRLNDELDKMTMSWTNELREWHPVVLKALDYSSIVQLNVPVDKYPLLFKTDTHGINMNVVMALCNNVEAVSPYNMGMTAELWCDFLQKNNAVGQRWEELVVPIRKKVITEFELTQDMPDKSKLIAMP